MEKLMEDTIMGLPVLFSVDGHKLSLRPPSLGQAYLINRHREGMADNVRELFARERGDVRLLDYRKAIGQVVAIATFRDKEDLLDPELLAARAGFLCEHLDDEDLFRLYDIVIAYLGDTGRFIKASGLEYDRKRLARIAKYKEAEGTFSFGGRTPYGSIIDRACERYGWTLDHVVWGISLTNLEMLLADGQSSCYLGKEDMRKLHIDSGREVIDMSDSKNNALLLRAVRGN